jgi:hypothetical protein
VVERKLSGNDVDTRNITYGDGTDSSRNASYKLGRAITQPLLQGMGTRPISTGVKWTEIEDDNPAQSNYNAATGHTGKLACWLREGSRNGIRKSRADEQVCLQLSVLMTSTVRRD